MKQYLISSTNLSFINASETFDYNTDQQLPFNSRFLLANAWFLRW